MDFMDFLSSVEGDSYGYKTFSNKVKWDNTRVLQLLSSVETPFGKPKMGWIRAFGKEREVVVYSGAHDTNYIYIDAKPRKIIVSMAPKPGQIGGPVDHIIQEDYHETDEDTVCATLSSIEPVNIMVEIIKELLKKEGN